MPTSDSSTWPYVPSPGFDEAIGPDGAWRPAWRAFAAVLGAAPAASLLERQRHADRLLDAEGAGHVVHDLAGTSLASRPWRLDPVPVLVDQADWSRLVEGVAQRTRVLEAVVADLYGAQRLVSEGVVRAAQVWGEPRLRLAATEQRPTRWLVHHAVDIVRTAGGEWRVVGDLTDSPTGLGYALLNRSVAGQVMSEEMRRCAAAPVAVAVNVLRSGLAALAVGAGADRRTVVLSGGPEHPSYVEHSYLAVQMGLHLAEGGDLVVRQGRLWLRALGGLEPVDVVYRRLEDAGLDPLEPRAVGAVGVPAITWAARAAGVVLGNAFGAGLGESAVVRAALPDAAAMLCGERLVLDTYRDEPLARTPVLADDGTLQPGRVVLRLHAVHGPDGVWVMPGGAGRVLREGDDPAEPTALRTKDVWVVGGREPSRTTVRTPATAQVDLGGSVPTRAADALYWMGRAAERAEVAARAARVVSGQLEVDPGLLVLGDGGWAIGALALLRAAQGVPIAGTVAAGGEPLAVTAERELAATRATVVTQASMLQHEAGSVRQYLSTTTGRVLGRLVRVVADLQRPDAAVDDLDLILVDLAALSGLAMESTVRGPAWRFLDLGRRLERALALLGSLEAALGPAIEPLATQPVVEVLLSANESLVAYRRRYRSEVEVGAVVELLVRDDSNPRGLAFQIDRLREHVASLGWSEGSELVERAARAALAEVDGVVVQGRRLSVDGLVVACRGPLLDLGEAVVRRWFADPVNPMPMGGR